MAPQLIDMLIELYWFVVQDVLTLAANDVIDHAMIDHILLSGFSRIPVHEVGSPQSFMGMLLVKKVGCAPRPTPPSVLSWADRVDLFVWGDDVL